jgi:SAM-dependent methyltransferase
MDHVEVTICPLCGASESDVFDRRLFHDEPVTNRICKKCGFVFQSPRMTQARLDQFYVREYRQLYQGDAGPVPKDLIAQSARAANLLAFLRSHGVTHLSRHLDIGASAGLLLQAIRSDYRCESVGVEPGLAYRELSQKAGLKVYPHLEDMPTEGESCFDLVSLVHVLEHMPDPVWVLAQLRQDWLAEGGWLLVEVPNLYCHDCFEVAHLASFSQHTLTQVLNKAGYHLLVVSKHGQPRSRLLPLYITLLAQPMTENELAAQADVRPDPVGGVRFKRRLGLARRRVVERLLPNLAWLP